MWLIASDLHLTDNPKDDYRNGILKWLGEKAEANDVTEIIILGDVTDRKDNHSGALLNFIVNSLADLSNTGKYGVHALKGNHDYADPTNPTLGILSRVEGDLQWYGSPKIAELTSREGSIPALFLPFQRDEENFSTEFCKYKIDEYKVAFFHQTFSGSITSTGMRLPGIETTKVFRAGAKMFSGDIHVPQMVGTIEYVGSPYQINFGDKFEGRVILFDPITKNQTDLHYPCLRKHTLEIEDPDEILDSRAKPGDQVKVRLSLTRAQLDEWSDKVKEVERICKEKELGLFALEVREVSPKRERLDGDTTDTKYEKSDPGSVFKRFCETNEIPEEIEKTGEAFIR